MKKKIGLIIGILIFSLLMVGSTMAYWTWRGYVNSVNVVGYTPFNCAADGGIHASTVSLMPAACTHDRFAIQREITVDHELFSPNTSVYMDMMLNVNNIGAGLAASSNFKYALTKSPDSCTKDVVSSGTFKNITNGTTINLFDDKIFDYSKNKENKYYLYIWIDSKEENRNVLNQNFNFSLDLVCTQGYESGAQMLVNKANDTSITTYSSGNTKEMYAFSQPETEQLSATTDYRYIGSSPNNYIIFNNETWRIIGVFDGKIKIISDNRIGSSNISWDYKKTGVGSSISEYGSNDWLDSQLMYMLNPNDITTNVAKKAGYTFDGTYIKDANEKIIYRKGCNPSETDGTSYSCTTNSWSLNSTALSQIANVSYYLGGASTQQEHSALSYYNFERGAAIHDNVRSISWNGKVGLMYPSDYAYTYGYGVDDKCYNDTYSCSVENGAVPSSSWLHTPSHNQWTLSVHSGYGSVVFYILSTSGNVSITNAYSLTWVRPVVYLKDSTLLMGDGTSRNPYVISTADSYIENTASLQGGAATLVNKANGINITSYSVGDTGEMYTFSQPATVQVPATTDYRYIGSNPNNYISFNNETWRIIGVFDGKIKIIRDTVITNTRWDYKQSGVGSSTSADGSNDWIDSQLMYMLNPRDIATNVALKTGYTHDETYVYDANGKIIYQKGCKPVSTDGSTYSCTANTWSLNDTALSHVSDETYYLGGTKAYTSLSTSDFYGIERGTEKYNAVRSTNWIGKVGLMYPSDYGYTFAYGVDDTCYSTPNKCNSSTPSSSWLYTSSYIQWMLSPYTGSANDVFRIYSTGHVYDNNASLTDGVRPVVYLKSDIKLTGTGTSGNPYTIVS